VGEGATGGKAEWRMTENTKDKPDPPHYTRDHLANERTFLAWVRTSIGIMAFGFVVEKFALFMKKLAIFLEQKQLSETPPAYISYSTAFGIILVAMGAFMGLLSFIRYKKVEREIMANAYQPSLLLDILVTMSIMVIGIFLVFYMVHSIRD
jgi:putative membrane protein